MHDRLTCEVSPKDQEHFIASMADLELSADLKIVRLEGGVKYANTKSSFSDS